MSNERRHGVGDGREDRDDEHGHAEKLDAPREHIEIGGGGEGEHGKEREHETVVLPEVPKRSGRNEHNRGDDEQPSQTRSGGRVGRRLRTSCAA